MRIERVVVGVDFSRPGADAATWVATWLAPNAELILAHVIDLPRTPSFLRALLPPTEEAEPWLREEAESRLGEMAGRLGRSRVRTVIRSGPPHDELARLAAETGADLVAVGPHGDRPRPFKMLGSTAERLTRAAAPAVLVVVNARQASPRRVLVGVDDAPITSTVLDWTKGIADALGAGVTAVHVLGDAGPAHVRAAGTTADEGDRGAQAGTDAIGEATRWLTSLADAGLGQGRADAVVVQGRSGDAILEVARDVAADLIILGRRGSGTLIPAIAGSTVSTVLYGAPAPVLVVTEEPADWSDAEEE